MALKETRIDNLDAGHVSEPPDGGLRAWLQVVAGHLVVFNAWGYTISFGIFQPYYETELNLPPSTVAWVGSVQICLIFLVGTFSGRAFDAGYYRLALIVGLSMQILGIFMTSIAKEYWQVLLSQGFCQGLGCGIVFAPTIANMSTYFSKKRTIAISTAACGGTTGGMVFPLIAQQLLPKIGFHWTVRVMGLIVMVTSVIVLCLAKTRLPPRKAGPIVEFGAFKETTYLLFAISMFFTLWATWYAYYYARTYALSVLNASSSQSFTFLLIINAVGIPGRMVPAYLADRYFGPINVFIPTIIAAALCIFLWAKVSTLVADYVWVVVFGYFGAGIQSLFPSTTASLTKDLSKNGTRIGMVFTIISVAALTGPPLAGKLIEVTGGKYLAAQMWGGACLLLGASLLTAAKLMETGQLTHDIDTSLLAPALLQRARSMNAEYDALQKSLNESFDATKAKRVGELSRVASALKAWEESQASVKELKAMLDDPEQDADLASIATDELNTETGKLESLARNLSASLTPRHPFADFPCMIEFRPGPGGLEGRYFTDSLFKMYKALCMRKGYRHNVMKYEFADTAGDSSSSAGENPLQEAILEIQDQGAYDIFRSEAGMHRVQRIPSTESKGRVHTSAVAVWVLPSFPESGMTADTADFDDPDSDFYVNPQEVKIETMRARGAGGQHVNKTESAIRMTHIPTGTTVSMQDHRSQQRNREDAWKMMRSRIADQRREQREAEAANLRNSVLSQHQITRGDKIRTYNYNQDRCTDHRAGLDVHNLPDVLEGGETLDRIMTGANEWLVNKDISLLVAEEEAKEKAGKN
ncbi:putative translation releasing factor RF-1 [Mariannaea sp. PMI_226]|nr:putative translation releasing factor RF-1 [Mariannaea sp. PMI_226]